MRLLFALICAALLAGCGSVSVSTDYEPSYDYSKLKTWDWLHPKQPKSSDPRVDNALLDERVRESVEKTLASKGHQRAAEKPDYRVAYYASIKERLDVTTMAGYRGMHERTYVNTYDEGSLVIDVLVDGALVWRGTGKGVVHENPTPEERAQRIREAVTEILASFPPAKKG